MNLYIKSIYNYLLPGIYKLTYKSNSYTTITYEQLTYEFYIIGKSNLTLPMNF